MALITVLIGAGFGLLGAVLGYMLRIREWQREKRLIAYTEFIGAFFEMVRKALVMFVGEPKAEQQWRPVYDDFVEAWLRFGASRAQVSLLATDATYVAAANCNAFASEALWSGDRGNVPFAESERIQWEGLKLEQAFILAAARELGPRLFTRRKAELLMRMSSPRS